MKLNKKIIGAILSFLILICGYIYNESFSSPLDSGKNVGNFDFGDEDVINVHFLDVGQGDCIFIELPNKQTMLIDAGESSSEEKIANYIDTLGYNAITYVVATHPHADHIGGLENIVKNFDINKIYMPKASSNSKTFQSLLEAISTKGLKINTAKKGVNIINDEKLTIEILMPLEKEYDNLNNYSVVLKITYKEIKFLFMGDAEKEVENEITGDVLADVIKVGHHGSETSSSKSFISKVKPKYAIISVGENNQYNHPNVDVLKAYENIGAKIYRTDINGNIVITSNGEKININLEK